MPVGGSKSDADRPLMRHIIVEWMRDKGGHLSQDEFIDDANRQLAFPRPAALQCGKSTRLTSSGLPVE
jgi:hypothetical protein